MAYNQKELGILGGIVANHEKKKFREVVTEYEEHFKSSLSRIPRRNSHINVLMHTLGYFSKQLSSNEKAFFLELLEKYRNDKIPISAVLSVARAWIIKFEEKYLTQQSFFEPYPEDLVEITDSGKGRNL